MFLSEGNGKIIDRDVSVSELGEGSFLEVRGGDVLYGGVRGLSEGDYVKRGVVLSWTRNDTERVRFSGDFDLLGGGNRLSLGVVGGDLARLVSFSEGVELRIGGDGLDDSEWSSKIGGGEIVFTDGELGEYVFLGDEKVVYGGDGSLRIKEGEFDEGLEVWFVGVELLGVEVLGVDSGEAFLSPVPYVYEHIYLRVGSEGHIGSEQMTYCYSDAECRGLDLGEYGVALSLSSGLLRFGSSYEGKEIRYEGLLLGRCGELVSEQVVTNGGLVSEGDILSTGVDSVSGELVGLGYGSVFLNVGGVSLLPVVSGDKVRSGDRAYFGSDGRIRLKRGVELLGQVRGTGILKLVQSFFPCRMERVGVSQKKVLGLDGSVDLASGGVVSYTPDGVVTGNGVISPSGHLVLGDGEDFASYDESLGAVPLGLGTGVVLALRGEGVNGFRELEDFIVSDGLRSGSTFSFLDFVPRTDFSGYGVGSNYFKAGEEVLKLGEDLEYDFADRRAPKVGWIEGRTRASELKNPTSFFQLESGVVVGSTSIKLSSGTSVEVLTEGLDYDLPFEAQGGFARQIAELGGERTRGYKSVKVSDTEAILSDLVLEPSVGNYLVYEGDSLYREVLSFLKEESGGHRVELSSGSIYDLRGNETVGDLTGGWVLYEGVLGDVSGGEVNLMRVNDECFVDLPLSDEPFLRVYKTYSASTAQEVGLVLSKVSPKSVLSARLEGGSDVPLVVLSNEVLPNRVMDVSSAHYVSGDYKILVDGVENTSFSVGAEGLISFSPVIDDLSEVVFQPQPRSLETQVEYLNGVMGSSLPVVKVLEELVDTEYRVQPITGVISFSQPLDEAVGVEVLYTPVDPETQEALSQKRETILFVKTLETCTRVSDRLFTFSESAYLDITPQVYVDVLEASGVVVRDGEIEFVFDVAESATVAISYVREGSLGGEYTVKVAEEIFKPFIQLSAHASEMTLSERSSIPELSVGEVLDLGSHSVLVSGVSGNVISFSPPLRFGLNVSSIKRTSRADLFLSVEGADLTSKGKSSDLFLKGNYRDLIAPNSVLILEGSTPHRVRNVVFLEEGVTQVAVYGYASAHVLSSFSVSVRPIPNEGDVVLGGVGAVAVDLGSVLIKERNGLGLPLEPSVDYLLEPDTGVVTLINGHRVEEGTRYTLRYTAISSVSPTYNADGSVSYPKYSATYSVRTDASKYEGLPLLAKCVIETKDKFILPIVDEDSYSAEISAQLLQESSPTSGEKQGSTPSPRQGVSVGLFDNLARDVIARNKISFYHAVSNVVDDWVSTTTGKVVGDQDGRFRFDIEQGDLNYVGDGLEDPVTRVLKPRYAPLEFLEGIDITLTEKDDYSGLSVNTLRGVYRGQVSFVENEMDDYVLVGTKTVRSLSLIAPFLSVDLVPRYAQMWKPHGYSRLYPERGSFFSVLYPSDVGYSYPETEGSVIGQIENGSKGEIKGITGISSLRKRPCRMRVLDFKPYGYPSVVGSKGRPTFLVSVVSYDEFPYDAQGNPDTSKLIYEGNPTGEFPSVITGNPSLSFGGLSVGSVLELGRQGSGFSVLLDNSEQKQSDANLFPDLFSSAPKKVRVREVVEGCYVVLEGRASSMEWSGLSLTEANPRKGDTLLESLQGDIDDTESRGGFFRVGSDVGVNNGSGEVVDISLPSVSDPNFPLKEIFEQNTPSPLLSFEGEVQFANRETSPFLFSALLGDALNDSGDESIPYLSQLSERELLADVTQAMGGILRITEGGSYVYPDEIPDDEGEIASGKLILSSSLTPFSDGEIGSKDVEQGDLVLVDLSDGASGLIEVSTVDGGILPPRFKAPVSQGNLQYKLTDYYEADVSVSGIGLRIGQFQFGGGYLTKFLLATNATPTDYLTYDALITFIEQATSGKHNSFDLSFLGAMLNFVYDGAWEIFDNLSGNHISVNIDTYGANQGQPIVDRGFEIFSPTPVISQAVWTTVIIPNGGVLSTIDHVTETYILDGASSTGHDFKVSLNFLETDVYLGGNPTTEVGGSQTAQILSDRLSLSENGSFLGGLASSNAELEIGVCDVGAVANSDINSTANINGGVGFNPLTGSANTLRVPAFYGYGNTPISKSGLKLTTLVGSRVTEGSTIYEEVGATLNYDLGAVEASGDLSFSRPQDLIFIDGGHSSGTHRIEGVITEPITSAEYTVFAPKIMNLTDNGDGTFDIELSSLVSEYYDPSPVEVSVIISQANIRSADAPTANASGVILTVDSVDGSTLTVSGIVSDLDGVGVEGGISDLIREGQDLIGFDRVSFDPNKTEIGFSFLRFSASAIDGDSSFTPHGVGLSFDINPTNSSFSNGLGYLYLNNSAPPPSVHYLLTGDKITLTVDIKKGLYIDPSFPRMCNNYGSSNPNYFGTATAYGLYDPSGAFTSEIVDVSVRRLRRFSDIFLRLSSSFSALNPLYEIRRGLVNTLTKLGNIVTLTASPVNREGVSDPSGKDTQVGDFAEAVSMGDKITVLNSDGDQAMRLKVLSVGSEVKCLYISGDIPVGASSFSVEVRNGIVPQEQIFDKFVGLSFSEIYSSELGKVQGGSLRDGNASLNFLSFESLIGQYILIDPQGSLDTPDEYGAPPQGDTGKISTTGYVVGSVSPFDDNRGLYKIVGVEADNLTVEPVIPVEGIAPSDYSFLPSVNGVDGTALRDTAPQANGTHDDPSNSSFSIEPFSYKILKANTEVAEEMIASVMMMRERTLSWMELLSSFNEIRPYTWSEYVSEGLISEVGEDDKTYLTNEELLVVEGNTGVTPLDVPFVTNSRCLSVLARRFLVEDDRLLFEGYSEVGDALPSLLENGISFIEAREKRYSWLNVRAGLLTGTLAKIDRVDFNNPNNKALEDINDE
jgi:hypothetical protein